MEKQNVIEIVKALGITAEELGIEPTVKTVTEKDTQLIHEISQYITEREDEEAARDYISEKYWDDLNIRPEKKYKIVKVTVSKKIYKNIYVAMPEDENDCIVDDYLDDLQELDSCHPNYEEEWEVYGHNIDEDNLTETAIKDKYEQEDIWNYDYFAEQ